MKWKLHFMNMHLIFYLTFTMLIFNLRIGHAQSFSNEKTSAINFVKRVYASSPFEGVENAKYI
jgi:hypothetical protein